MDILKCPVCDEKIIKYPTYYRCQNNHSFDIAKEGYTNVLLNQSSKSHGDSKNMLQARKYVQEQGYYSSIAKSIVSVVEGICVNQIVDIGCGIGYYTAYIAQTVKTNVIGIDISKAGLKIAAKEDSFVRYFVASNESLPIIDESVDLLMNIFSPINLDEVKRVLKLGGHIVVVSPNVDHLIELKEIIYEKLIYKNEHRNDIDDARLQLVKTVHVKESMNFDRTSLHQLFLMTPHYWTSSRNGKAKLDEIDDLTLTIDVSIRLYKRI